MLSQPVAPSSPPSLPRPSYSPMFCLPIYISPQNFPFDFFFSSSSLPLLTFGYRLECFPKLHTAPMHSSSAFGCLALALVVGACLWKLTSFPHLCFLPFSLLPLCLLFRRGTSSPRPTQSTAATAEASSPLPLEPATPSPAISEARAAPSPAALPTPSPAIAEVKAASPPAPLPNWRPDFELPSSTGRSIPAQTYEQWLATAELMAHGDAQTVAFEAELILCEDPLLTSIFADGSAGPIKAFGSHFSCTPPLQPKPQKRRGLGSSRTLHPGAAPPSPITTPVRPRRDAATGPASAMRGGRDARTGEVSRRKVHFPAVIANVVLVDRVLQRPMQRRPAHPDRARWNFFQSVAEARSSLRRKVLLTSSR